MRLLRPKIHHPRGGPRAHARRGARQDQVRPARGVPREPDVRRAADLAELRDPLDAFYDFGEDDPKAKASGGGGFAEESGNRGASSSNNPNRTLATLATRGAGRATRTANGSELILPGAGSSGGGGAVGRRRVSGTARTGGITARVTARITSPRGGSRSDERRVERRQPAQRLATRESQKRQNQIATRAMRHAKAGASKALAAPVFAQGGVRG